MGTPTVNFYKYEVWPYYSEINVKGDKNDHTPISNVGFSYQSQNLGVLWLWRLNHCSFDLQDIYELLRREKYNYNLNLQFKKI